LVELVSCGSWQPVFGLGENIWGFWMFCCPAIMLIILDAEWKVLYVINKVDEVCIGMA